MRWLTFSRSTFTFCNSAIPPCCNNSGMVVVRYAALAALVVWLAGMLVLLFGDALRDPSVSLASGAIVLVSLIVIKFVGPPPRAFFARVAIVGLMLIVTVLAWLSRVPASIAVRLNAVFAAVLLFWYVHE